MPVTLTGEVLFPPHSSSCECDDEWFCLQGLRLVRVTLLPKKMRQQLAAAQTLYCKTAIHRTYSAL